MSPKRKSPQPARRSKGFTEAERAAMKDRVEEMRGAGEGDSAVLAKIGGMKEPDRTMGKRIHAIVRASAPALEPKLWYGMPAYARDGKVVCFFQGAHKFKTRYATFGFSDKANLDDGDLWPNGFAVKAVTPAVEAKLSALVRQAVS